MYLLIEIRNLFTGKIKRVIVPDNAINRAFYVGRIIYEGTMEDCLEELMNY